MMFAVIISGVLKNERGITLAGKRVEMQIDDEHERLKWQRLFMGHG